MFLTQNNRDTKKLVFYLIRKYIEILQEMHKYSETQLILMNKREKHCRTQAGRMGWPISEKKNNVGYASFATSFTSHSIA